MNIEQALQENSEEALYRPLVLTLRGELRLRSDQDGGTRFEKSEQDLREAVRVARSISAKSPELRATMSLARLLAKQGKRDEARAMLADIYNWFTEGFDTADLKGSQGVVGRTERLADSFPLGPFGSRPSQGCKNFG